MCLNFINTNTCFILIAIYKIIYNISHKSKKHGKSTIVRGTFMNKKPDDLEAVRTIITTLEAFEKAEQERIIRWSKEKLGLSLDNPLIDPTKGGLPLGTEGQQGRHQVARHEVHTPSDIKTFVTNKKPSSANQFAAVVAYYYLFNAPAEQRKEFINGDDLQEACRQIGRSRLKDPNQTLNNAHHVGLLDKTGDRGAYKINTVGENLVAVTLTGGTSTATASPRSRIKKRTIKTKKKPSKK